MKLTIRRFMLGLGLITFAACGTATQTSPLTVAWKFATGDCASNNVATVRIGVTRSFAAPVSATAACIAKPVSFGEAKAGSYSILVQGLNSNGAVVAQNYGMTLNLSSSGPLGDIVVTMYPKAQNVTVNWNGCPAGVVLPYHITLYDAPAQTGGALTNMVTTTQESCSASMATLSNVQPGDYVVKVDSQAVSPNVSGTAPVTVVAGQDAQVTVNVQ